MLVTVIQWVKPPVVVQEGLEFESCNGRLPILSILLHINTLLFLGGCYVKFCDLVTHCSH